MCNFFFSEMQGEGRKRKKDPPSEGLPRAQRTRDDVFNFDFTSILPPKEDQPIVTT